MIYEFNPSWNLVDHYASQYSKLKVEVLNFIKFLPTYKLNYETQMKMLTIMII